MRVPGLLMLLWGQGHRRSSLIPTGNVSDCGAVQYCPRKVTIPFRFLGGDP